MISCLSLIVFGVGVGVWVFELDEVLVWVGERFVFSVLSRRGVSSRRGLSFAFLTTVTHGFFLGGVGSGSSTPGGGATLFLGPWAAALVGRGVLGRVDVGAGGALFGCGVGAGGALFGCGEGTARCVVDSGVGVKLSGVGAGEGEGTSVSFPFLDLDFSLTVLAGFSGRATGFLLRGRGEGV